MKKLVLVTTLLAATMAYGQTNSSANLNASPTENTSTEASPESSASSSILKHVIAGWKSQNSSGRNDDLNSVNGRQVEAFQEVWLGYKHESGWGLYGLYANEYYAYKDTSKTKWALQDPSATLVHPAWYRGDNLRVTGKFRQYFPMSGYSTAHEMRQSAYYVDMTYAMAHRQEIYNNTTLRAFTYDNHGPSATKYYVEDTTNYTKYFSKNFRWGVGQWAQYEAHYNTPTGYCVELTPILDYAPTPKIFMGPRLRMPIVAHGAVYDGPTSASWNQAYFQFFLLANL